MWIAMIFGLAICGCVTHLPSATSSRASADVRASRMVAASLPQNSSPDSWSLPQASMQVPTSIDSDYFAAAQPAQTAAKVMARQNRSLDYDGTSTLAAAAATDLVRVASHLQEEPLADPSDQLPPITQLPTDSQTEEFGDDPPTNNQWLRLSDRPGAQDNVQVSSSNDLISLTARVAPLSTVLALIAEQHGLNVVTGADVNEQITVNFTNTRLEDALDAILAVNGYTWTRHRNIIIVSKIAGDQKSSPATQGRNVQVFTLNYVSATDVDKVVQGLISPVGQSFITQSMPTDHRRTHEQLVVEDLPEYLRRIEQYLVQADTPPQQVQIEAHVLQVTLKDNCRHGVNLDQILQLGHGVVTLRTVGMGSGTVPTSILRLESTDLDSLLDTLKATTDAKTLASPKVTVLNNQEAHMQVGAKIGYLLTTATQTSTLQSVNFLDVGVILTVLPSITHDGQVLLKVSPQVSTGRINPTTQLPESETTEVNTQVLLNDGEAIVIGGLIKETDSDSQNKVPILGDLWLVGWFFQRRETTRERNEIIITLVPRIVPDDRDCRCLDSEDVEQAHTPLLYGALESVDRLKFEPKLPSSSIRPRERPTYRQPHRSTPLHDRVPTYQPSGSPEVSFLPVVIEPAMMPNSTDEPLGLALPSENRDLR